MEFIRNNYDNNFKDGNNNNNNNNIHYLSLQQVEILRTSSSRPSLLLINFNFYAL